MKLSEAIREGAKLHPQGFGGFTRLENGEPCTCALGAAYEALTGSLAEGVGLDVSCEVWDELEKSTGCPIYRPLLIADGSRIYIKDEIVRMNDDLHTSREQIADWLEGLGY